MNKKGQVAGVVSAVVIGIIAVVLFISVLAPITTNLTKEPYYYNGTGSADVRNQGFTGTNKSVADNLVTFILIGTLLTIVGLYYTKAY